MFDFGTLTFGPRSDAGAAMDVLHPLTGEKVGPVMTVMGADSLVYQDELIKLRNKLAGMPEPGARDTAIGAVRNRARLAAAAVKSWTGVEFHGAVLPFTFDNAFDLFVTCPWLCDQVLAFRDNRGNYYEAPKAPPPAQPQVTAPAEG